MRIITNGLEQQLDQVSIELAKVKRDLVTVQDEKIRLERDLHDAYNKRREGRVEPGFLVQKNIRAKQIKRLGSSS